ncbi:MAG: Helix-turn-helix domain [Bacillota bacterium]|nr:Helix-turn-helix domain [Bacillota bacterium]
MDEIITMTAKETAKYLGICYVKLLSLAAAGEIPHFKINSFYYFRRDVFNTWFELKQNNHGNDSEVATLLKEMYPWIKIK